MKSLLFALLLGGISCTLAGKELPVEIPGKKGWNLRGAKNEVFIKGNSLFFDTGKKTIMAATKEPVKLICHFGQVRVKGKLKGKGTFNIGFHSYTAKQYYATRTSRKVAFNSPDKFVDLEHLQLFGDFNGKGLTSDMFPDRGFVCIYASPGSKGEIKDLTIEVTRGPVDKTSPISLEKPAPDEFSLNRKLLLPPVIYAVEGVEMNIYYDNVFLVPDVKDFAFSFEYNTPGKNYGDRWSFTPGKKHVGKTRTVTMTVQDLTGTVVAKKSFLLKVAPASAGAGKDYSLLMIGDSITDFVKAHPTHVFDLFAGKNNPSLTMVGTKVPHPKREGIRHEGYSGWSYASFLNKGPFVKMVNGLPVLDFEGYFKRNNKGKAPDFVTIQLGVNDIFGARDYVIRTTIRWILSDMDRLITALRKAAPDTVIGIGLPTPGASQDAFGKVYGCRQSRYQYKRNIFALSSEIIKRYHNSPDRKIFIIPTMVNLDTVHNFPTAKVPVNSNNKETVLRQSDALHMNEAGGRQLGDTLYGFLKVQMNQMSQKKK